MVFQSSYKVDSVSICLFSQCFYGGAWSPLSQQQFGVLITEILYTGQLINNRNLFLTVLGSPRSGCQCGRVLVKVLFQVADCRLLGFSVVSSHGRKQKEEASSLVTHKGTHPTDESFTLMIASNPNYPPKISPPNTITCWERGVRFQHMNLGRTQTFSP